MARLSLPLIIFSVCLTASPVHLIVPPKTPLLSGFEPAAIGPGTYREFVCDASQPDADTITYKWYKYAPRDSFGNTWELKGPIGTSQKYIFSPVPQKQVFHQGRNAEHVSGKYKCRASNSAGTRDSAWGDFYVYTPCSLYTVSVTPAKSAVGSTFIVKCNIPNPSGMTVTWTKQTDTSSSVSHVAVANSKGCHAPTDPHYSWSSCSPPSLSSKTKTYNVEVTNAQTSDIGYWICKDIGLSCHSDPVKPAVQAPPETPQITGFPTGPVTAGTQVNLKCEASPPGDTYDWYEDDTKLSTSLTYDFIAKKEGARAVYKCVARNGVGAATSSNKTLIVYFKADSVFVSSVKTTCYAREKDRFTCTATGGYPQPTLKIYIKRSGGTPVEVTQGQDRVMVKEDNQAEFYSEATVAGYPSLDMTSPKKTYNVTFAHTKVSFINNPTATIKVGQVKKFTCETDESNPITSIKWYQSVGGSLQDVTSGITSSERNGAYGGKIRISEWSVTATKAMNGATVRCSSSYSLTGHGFIIHADAVMSVKFNPSKITMIQKPDTTIHEGQLITIVCETDSANPGADIQFSRKRTGENWVKLTSGITSEDRNAPQYNGKKQKSTLTMTANRLDNQAVCECKVKKGTFQVDQTTSMAVYYPPTLKLSSNPKPVEEGQNLTLTCEASGGNPTSYTYSWYYNNLKQSATSKQYTITGIKYTQSGKYKCEAINYSPGGKAVAITDINVLYKAKWNPALPEFFTVASKTNEPVTFVLHVIANPPHVDVTWSYQNNTAIGKEFTASKVNDATYTLTKTSVTIKDYGNYTVNVTNRVGVSTFVFELQRAGPPYLPCCLKMVKTTAVSILVTFKSNFSGGSQQTFTIDWRSSGGNGGKGWVIAAKQIPDPGFEKDILQKIPGLTSGMMHQFRVKAVNADGSSGYGNILTAKTAAAPHTVLKINRDGKLVIATWTPLGRRYTKLDIKYCTIKGGVCNVFSVKDLADVKTRFPLDNEGSYEFYLRVFDGEDIVFVTPPVRPAPAVGNGGVIAGVVASVVVLVAIIVVVVVIMKRRSKACFSGEDKQTTVTFDNTSGDGPEVYVAGFDSGPVYMNVDNKGFKAEVENVEPVYVNDSRQTHQVAEVENVKPGYVNDSKDMYQEVNDPREAEPEYDELNHEPRVPEIVYEDVRPTPSAHTAPKNIDDITVAEFKQWLLSKQVTESTYNVLVKKGFNKAAIFVLLQRDKDFRGLHIKPLGQEVLVRNLVKSFDMFNEGKGSHEAGASSRDGSAPDDMENPYAELNITPDVIADQVYTDLIPSKKWQHM